MIKLNENTQQNYNVNSIKDLEEIAKSMFNLIKKNNYDFKDLIHYFEKDNNFDYKFRTKIWNDLNVYEMPKTYDNILNVLTTIVKANDKEITNETSDLNMSDLNNDLNQGKLQQVQAGEVIKLQKPQQDTYTDIITNNDGVEIGTCSVCGATDVIVADHICKTVVQPFESIKNKYGTTANKMLTKIEWFKNVVLENKTK